MKFSNRCCLLLPLVLLLMACGTTPSAVRLPTVVALSGTADADESRYRLGEKSEDPLLSQATNTVLPIEKTYKGVRAQVRAHQVLWQKESDELARGVDGLGNTQFAGAVIGAAGVLANSIDIGKVGAGIAGAAGVWGDRYKLSVQSSNYRLGAVAMQCVFKRITAIPEGFWEATYVDDVVGEYGKMRFKRQFYVNDGSGDQAAASKGYDTLKGLFIKVHETVLEIRSRLGEAQRAVKLTSPSGTEIAGALKVKQESEKPTETQSLALTKGVGAAAQKGAALAEKLGATSLGGRKLGLLTTPATSDDQADEAARKALALDEETLQQALQLPQDLDTCAKLIGP